MSVLHTGFIFNLCANLTIFFCKWEGLLFIFYAKKKVRTGKERNVAGVFFETLRKIMRNLRILIIKTTRCTNFSNLFLE